MAKVIIPQIGIDKDVFEWIEEQRETKNMARATFINQTLKEAAKL